MSSQLIARGIQCVLKQHLENTLKPVSGLLQTLPCALLSLHPFTVINLSLELDYMLSRVIIANYKSVGGLRDTQYSLEHIFLGKQVLRWCWMGTGDSFKVSSLAKLTI